MREKYSGPDELAADPALDTSEVEALLSRLLPGANGALLLHALLAEGPNASIHLPAQLDAEASPAARELARVRRLFQTGEGAQSVHLAMSNTLTALQTEAQLLELEPLADEHRRASTRIVELTRRLATVMRRLDPPGGST
jgi:hypothetical protein